MIDSRTTSRACVAGLALVLVAQHRPAQAQSYDAVGQDVRPGDGIPVGEWTFRPSIELRTHGEYRRRPFDTASPATTDAAVPDPVQDQGFLFARTRVGLTADQEAFRLAVQIQDTRAWGEVPPWRVDRRDSQPNTAPHVAYGELHTPGDHPSSLRVGRQEITWGEGRLLSSSDWSATGRSFDAARGLLVVGAFDIDAFASMLTPPGATPPDLRRDGQGRPEGTGAQLYGLRIAWHLSPLLLAEWNNLGRIVRNPVDGTVAPSDLGLTGLRLSGGFERVTWSAEGAYEVGRTAIVGSTENLRAFAAAARIELSTGLPGRLSVGVQGAYASGRKNDGATASGDDTRFDPLFPDVHDAHGPMGLYAWSNVIEAAAQLRMTPLDEVRVTLGWRYVAMAEPSDWWRTAALVPIGRSGENTNRNLGQEVDATIGYTPWEPLRIVAGYGLFRTGEGAKNILASAGRGRPDMQHCGYLQLTMHAP